MSLDLIYILSYLSFFLFFFYTSTSKFPSVFFSLKAFGLSDSIDSVLYGRSVLRDVQPWVLKQVFFWPQDEVLSVDPLV